MSKSYELNLHYKQGDDFACHLEACRNDTVAALRAWANSLQAAAEHAKALAYDIERSGKKVEADADTHFIGLHGDEALLNELAEKGLLTAFDYEDEEGDAV